MSAAKEVTLKILRFTKIEHTAFSLPLIFTGAWMGGAGSFPSLWILVLIILAATGARVFGMAFNRIFDRRIDAMNPRTAGRELPSGAMGLTMALFIALGGLALYLAACALLGGWCAKLAVIPLIPLLGYSLLKRVTPFCHFGIGLCLALAPLGAFVAAAGHPRFSPAVILFSLFVFCWLSGADIIYALLDIESDRKNGIHSLPARLGVQRAEMVAAGVHLAALISLFIIVLIYSPGRFAWLGWGVTALALVGTHLPFIPAGKRFFPISTIAGIAGAVTPLLG